MKRCIVLLVVLASACSSEPRSSAQKVVSSPRPTTPTTAPTTPPAPSAAPTKAPAAGTSSTKKDATLADVAPPRPKPPSRSLQPYTDLGSWIDVFDHTNDPDTIVPLVRDMASRGARTLYLETARWKSATDIDFPVALGAALDEAKAKGMRAVAWYPPGFDDVGRDVRRSLAAINFRSPKGNRFDAFGADIEYTQGVPDAKERSKRTIEYSRQLRQKAPSVALAAIVIPPTSLALNQNRWADFPWAALSGFYDLFMPMNYWTAHGKDPATAADLTERNIAQTKALTGKPVHIIGGLGEYADQKQVAAYVKEARDGGSIGGGLYDFTTTRPDAWSELRKLNG